MPNLKDDIAKVNGSLEEAMMGLAQKKQVHKLSDFESYSRRKNQNDENPRQ